MYCSIIGAITFRNSVSSAYVFSTVSVTGALMRIIAVPILLNRIPCTIALNL